MLSLIRTQADVLRQTCGASNRGWVGEQIATWLQEALPRLSSPMDTTWWLELLGYSPSHAYVSVLEAYIPHLDCWTRQGSDDWSWLARVSNPMRPALFRQLKAHTMTHEASVHGIAPCVYAWMLHNFPHTPYLDMLAWLDAAAKYTPLSIPSQYAITVVCPDKISSMASLLHHPLARRHVHIDWQDAIKVARNIYRLEHPIRKEPWAPLLDLFSSQRYFAGDTFTQTYYSPSHTIHTWTCLVDHTVTCTLSGDSAKKLWQLDQQQIIVQRKTDNLTVWAGDGSSSITFNGTLNNTSTCFSIVGNANLISTNTLSLPNITLGGNSLYSYKEAPAAIAIDGNSSLVIDEHGVKVQHKPPSEQSLANMLLQLCEHAHQHMTQECKVHIQAVLIPDLAQLVLEHL
jgi:hypothetical protein